MTDKTNPPDEIKASNVTHLNGNRAAHVVQLRDDFAQSDGFGFKGLDNTPAGRVVRLGDVVRWLEKNTPCPRGEAVSMVLDALQPAHMSALCELDLGKLHAHPLDVDGRFGCRTQNELNKAWRGASNTRTHATIGSGSNWATMGGALSVSPAVPRRWADSREFKRAAPGTYGAQVSMPEPGAPGGPAVAVEPGLPALLATINREWAHPTFKNRHGHECIDEPRLLSSRLAILLTVAHELWLCGRVAEEQCAPLAPVLPVAPAQPVPPPAPDPFAGVSADLCKGLNDLKRQRGKTSATKGKKGTRWTDLQRVTADDLVRAVDALRPGTGQRALAEALGVALSVLNGNRGVLQPGAVARSRKALDTARAKVLSPNSSPFKLASSL